VWRSRLAGTLGFAGGRAMLVNTYCKIPTSWQLRGLLFILSVFFLGCASTNTLTQTPSLFQTGSELDVMEYKDPLIGQKLWFVPDTKKLTCLRIGFAKSPDYDGIKTKNLCYPTDTVTMKVIKKAPGKGWPERLNNYYRLKLKDGSILFIKERTLKKDFFFRRSSDIERLDTFFKEDPVLIKKKIAKLEAAEKKRRKKREAQRKAQRKEIEARGGVLVGMTKAQVLSSSWGKPIEVNTTIMKGVVSEQWVYHGHNYLYFDNDRLTAIQTSK